MWSGSVWIIICYLHRIRTRTQLIRFWSTKAKLMAFHTIFHSAWVWFDCFCWIFTMLHAWSSDEIEQLFMDSYWPLGQISNVLYLCAMQIPKEINSMCAVSHRVYALCAHTYTYTYIDSVCQTEFRIDDKYTSISIIVDLTRKFACFELFDRNFSINYVHVNLLWLV